MKIRVGYKLIYDFPQPTPMIMVLGTHFTRAADIVVPDHLMTSPSVPIFPYRDVFGNWCSRIVAPAGRIRLWADGVVNDTGRPDLAAPWAAQHAIFLFVRSIFFRRPTRINEGFKEFKKQSDLAVSIFLFLIGCVVLVAAGKLVWTW